MKKNKKDYLAKTLFLQLTICLLLFAMLFAMKMNKISLFSDIKMMFSEDLEKNLNIEEAEAVFSNVLLNKKQNTNEKQTTDKEENETVYVPLEEPSLNAEIIATGGNDIKVSSDNDIPANVSINDYKLNQKMITPVNGVTTSEFGIRIHPISGDLRFHSGIDIAASEGTKIHAAFDGVVAEAGYDKWNGNYLKIKHENNIMTMYCHCKKINVEDGEKIRAGEVVAFVGSTGSSTGPHLHFELRINNISYNPQKALKEADSAV